MRIVITGASALAIYTTEILVGRNDDVVIVDPDSQKLRDLSDRLDCGFMEGDGSRPAVLKETGPDETDVLLCLTDHDRDNLITALVGRSLGFPRVVPKIEDSDLVHVCTELGLEDTIVPDHRVAQLLADLVAGAKEPELSTVLRGEVRLFSFVAGKDDAGPVDRLDLPERARVILVYRGDDFLFVDNGTEIAEHDEVVMIAHANTLQALRERWRPG